MTAQTRVTNKGRFEDGDRPPGSDYSDLIASFVSIADSTVQSLTSDFSVPKLIATTEVSSPQVNATEVSASVANLTTLNAVTVSASTGNIGTLNATLVSASTANVNILNVQSVSASSGTYSGRLRVGTSASDLGDVVLSRTFTIPTNKTKVAAGTLPQGCDIIDIKMFVQTPPAASAASQLDVLVGTSVQDARFARFSNVSAQGYYTVPASTRTSAWNAVSGASLNIITHVTGSGAVASGTSGLIHILYVKRQ